MTAEIAIMNREAVALAADSAVTITQGGAPKIFASANKLFALSRHQPVGIMVYGNASFMAVPWETVIKTYRAQLEDTAYGTVQEYAEDLISFLKDESLLAPEESQEMYVQAVLNTYFDWMFQEMKASFERKIREEAVSKPEDAPRLFREEAQRVISSHYESWRKAAYAEDMGASLAGALRKQYLAEIRRAKKSAFGSLLTSATSRQLTHLAGWILTKYDERNSSPGESGLVIAGFGKDEIFPSIRSFVVSGIAGGKLKLWRDERGAKDITVSIGAWIIPFAQDEMVRSFMEGIEPNYWIDILSAVTRILREYPIALIDSIQGVSNNERERLKRNVFEAFKKIFEAFSEDFDDIKVSRYIDPVVSTIATMPKSELPAVAEALVNLQSFKRRVSGEQETVGGPIDVMLISKGDGLIWIKRKHYFDRALNPQYLRAAFREDRNGASSLEKAHERRIGDD